MKNRKNKMKTKRVKSYLCGIFIADIVGVNTFKEFEDVLYDVFLYGGAEKFMFIDDKTYKQIKPFIARDAMRDTNIYITKFGEIRLAYHDNTVPEGELLFVDCDFNKGYSTTKNN